jgi:hypothetical protein
MRDILDQLDSLLIEANLGANEIPATKPSSVTNPRTGQLFSRPELFLNKVVTGSPFTLVSGGEVVVDPREARRVRDWIVTGPQGAITLKTTDGGTVKNTQMLKTVEFGSKESQTIRLKGSDIFDTEKQDLKDFGNSIDDVLRAGGFPAAEMYSKIADNPKVQQLGQIGDAVILMARQANSGQVPEFPTGLSKEERKAIELYASEYLGVLGLLTGATKFPDRKQFNEFLGTDLNDMIMFFPKDSANPLADSFSVVNDETGHALKISSKAAGKGAPPSLSSIKLPADVRQEYPEVAGFYDLATDPRITAFTQPFAMMNWLYENVPDAVPAEYEPLLPFTSETVNTAQQSYRTKSPMPRNLMRVFDRRLSDRVRAGDSTDGGKAWYAVITDVMTAVNDQDAVPGFQKAVIRSLGHNFVQLYTEQKGDRLETTAFWPAKIKGQAILKSKGSSKDPVGNKISVEVSPGKLASYTAPEVSAASTASDQNTDVDSVKKQRSSVTARSGGAEKPSPADAKTLGRKRR